MIEATSSPSDRSERLQEVIGDYFNISSPAGRPTAKPCRRTTRTWADAPRRCSSPTTTSSRCSPLRPRRAGCDPNDVEVVVVLTRVLIFQSS